MGHAFRHRLFLRPKIALVCVALAGIALAGCGRRGTLEPPPGSPVSQQRNADSAAQQARTFDQDQPGLIQSPDKFTDEPASVKLEAAQRKAAAAGAPRAINAPPVAKKSTFLLDPLL